MREASLEARWTRLAVAATVLLKILILILVVATIVEAAMQLRNYLDGIIRTERLLLVGGWAAAAIPAACTVYWGGRAILSQVRRLAPRREGSR